jgi:hypothetical protein
VSIDVPERCAPAMQTAVLAVDESFKCFRCKKQANIYAEYECVSQMPRMVNPHSKQAIFFGGCSSLAPTPVLKNNSMSKSRT